MRSDSGKKVIARSTLQSSGCTLQPTNTNGDKEGKVSYLLCVCVGFGAVVKIVHHITGGFDALILKPDLHCTISGPVLPTQTKMSYRL